MRLHPENTLKLSAEMTASPANRHKFPPIFLILPCLIFINRVLFSYYVTATDVLLKSVTIKITYFFHIQHGDLPVKNISYKLYHFY